MDWKMIGFLWCATDTKMYGYLTQINASGFGSSEA